MRSRLLLIIIVLGVAQHVCAANITNNITGVGPKDALINPYFCIQDANGKVTYSLAPAASVDANKYSGNPYYAGAALRFGGCDTEKNSYLGYLGVSGATLEYKAPEGVHVTLTNPTIDTQGNLQGHIQYTAIKPNTALLTSQPSQNADWKFVGANLSGLEFGKMIDPVVVPNLSKEDAMGKMSDLAETQAFLHAGMNTLRVPLHWGFLQLDGAGKGELNREYLDSFVKPLLESLTAAHIYTIVDLHSYMRYSKFGKEVAGCGAGTPCPDGTLITDANTYADVWTKLYAYVKSDAKIDMNYIMLDLVNEPVGVPNDLVFTIQAHVIKQLRAQGYQGYILVEGNAWSGLHAWTTTSWKSSDGKTTYTNATLFTRDNFIKAGVTDLSKILINVHQYLDSDYSGTHDQCLTDLKTTGMDGFNLKAFTDYLQQNHLQAIVTEFGSGRDSASCTIAMTAFMDYLKDNAAKNKDYGFVGWTIWSTGHGWGDYNLRVTPTSYHMTVLKKYLQAVE